MTAQTAEQANNVQRTQNMKMFRKRLCFWKCVKQFKQCICSKKHGFPNKYKNYAYLWLPRYKYVYVIIYVYSVVMNLSL